MGKFKRTALCLSLLGVLLTVAVAAESRADTVLRWKFNAGETIRYVMVQKMIMTQKMEGMPKGVPVTITMTQTADMSWAVQSVDADGVASITQTFDRMRMKMESPQGIMLDYDSASDKEPEGMVKMFASVLKAMVNKPISMKVTPRGEVSDVHVPQAMIDGFTKLPGMEKMSGFFSEDTLKEMSGIGELPEEAVSKGDTWTDEKEISFPMFGKMHVKVSNQYLGSETRDGKPLEKIAVTQEMDIKPGEEQAPFVVKMKVHKSSGTTYFDNVAGRFAEFQMKATMEFEITMGEKKAQSTMEMDIQMKPAPADSSPEPTPKP